MAWRILLLLLLCLAPAAAAEEEAPTFRVPCEFQVEGVRLRVSGAELTPDHRSFLVHVEAQEMAGQDAVIHWQDWFAAVTADGTRLRPPSEVGMDSGGGWQRVFGARPLPKGSKMRLLIYWPVYPKERPLRLWIWGGAISRDSWE